MCEGGKPMRFSNTLQKITQKAHSSLHIHPAQPQSSHISPKPTNYYIIRPALKILSKAIKSVSEWLNSQLNKIEQYHLEKGYNSIENGPYKLVFNPVSHGLLVPFRCYGLAHDSM